MKGRFQPRFPEKYSGDPRNIVYRSSWELAVMRRLDSHPDVLRWASEEVKVPYLDPVTRRVRNYWPDFVVERRGRDRKVEVLMVEVKPAKETVPPERGSKRVRRYLQEALTYSRNQAKWVAARSFCTRVGWKFVVWTERDLGLAS